MMPEGQDFIMLDNLNSGSFCQLNPEDMKAVLHHYKLYHADAPSKSTPQLSPLFLHSHLCSYLFSSYLPYTERFWGFITAHWHDLKAQMMAYQKADSAAQEAHCCLVELDELFSIWECICLAEYISLDCFCIDVQPLGAITGEVTDTYCKHPFHHPLLERLLQPLPPLVVMNRLLPRLPPPPVSSAADFKLLPRPSWCVSFL